MHRGEVAASPPDHQRRAAILPRPRRHRQRRPAITRLARPARADPAALLRARLALPGVRGVHLAPCPFPTHHCGRRRQPAPSERHDLALAPPRHGLLIQTIAADGIAPPAQSRSDHARPWNPKGPARTTRCIPVTPTRHTPRRLSLRPTSTSGWTPTKGSASSGCVKRTETSLVPMP